jgi:methyltransferase family protein
MPILANPKYERFAQLRADGKSCSEAYRIVAERAKNSDVNGDKWQRAPGVAERIAELQAKAADKCGLSREVYIKSLVEMYEAKPSDASMDYPRCVLITIGQKHALFRRSSPSERDVGMRLHRPLLAVTLVLAVLLSVVSTMAQQPLKPLKKKPDVPYVPSHEKVVALMLKVAKVGKNDILYDLGCGDGRIVITAAKRFGTRGVGVDIDPARIREARENAVKAGVADKVKFVQQDLFETDIREATVVTLFLLPEVNCRLRPKLLSDLKPGTRVVSHNFDMGDWTPLKTLKVRVPQEHTIYYWEVPPRTNR